MAGFPDSQAMDSGTRRDVQPMALIAGATVSTSSGPLPAGTVLALTATTTSGAANIPANALRTGAEGQNISTVVIGFREDGGVAAIGTAGTYTVQPGGTFKIRTSGLVNFIAASGTAAITVTVS